MQSKEEKIEVISKWLDGEEIEFLGTDFVGEGKWYKVNNAFMVNCDIRVKDNSVIKYQWLFKRKRELVITDELYTEEEARSIYGDYLLQRLNHTAQNPKEKGLKNAK